MKLDSTKLQLSKGLIATNEKRNLLGRRSRSVNRDDDFLAAFTLSFELFHDGFEEAFDGAGLSMATAIAGGWRMEADDGGEAAVGGEKVRDGGERRRRRTEEGAVVNCSNGHC
jgi:hypothetical protein